MGCNDIETPTYLMALFRNGQTTFHATAIIVATGYKTPREEPLWFVLCAAPAHFSN